MTLPAVDTAALFDIKGKSAIVIGATGAFGKVACATLANAGARLMVTAGNAGALDELKAELHVKIRRAVSSSDGPGG